MAPKPGALLQNLPVDVPAEHRKRFQEVALTRLLSPPVRFVRSLIPTGAPAARAEPKPEALFQDILIIA